MVSSLFGRVLFRVLFVLVFSYPEIALPVPVTPFQVYAYSPDMEGDPFTEGCLWSFNHFFLNKTLKRVLFLHCTTKRFVLFLLLLLCWWCSVVVSLYIPSGHPLCFATKRMVSYFPLPVYFWAMLRDAAKPGLG